MTVKTEAPKKNSFGEYLLSGAIILLCTLSLVWAYLMYFAITIALGDMLARPSVVDLRIGYPLFISIPLFVSAALARGAHYYGTRTTKPTLQRVSAITFWGALVLGGAVVAWFEHTLSKIIFRGSIP